MMRYYSTQHKQSINQGGYLLIFLAQLGGHLVRHTLPDPTAWVGVVAALVSCGGFCATVFVGVRVDSSNVLGWGGAPAGADTPAARGPDPWPHVYSANSAGEGVNVCACVPTTICYSTY